MELDPRSRQVPTIPPKEAQIRLIIDSDAKNEIDDQYAITLAILAPERFAIEGFIGATFDHLRGGDDPVGASVSEIERVLEKAGMKGMAPVLRGSDPMQYQEKPSRSEGVDYVIERAMAGSPANPLWVLGLGAATDIASAFLLEPRIVDRVVAFWHLRTHWPEKCINFNVVNDVRATRKLFQSPLSFVLGDTGTYLRASLEETEREVKPYGEIGRYLHEIRYASPQFMRPKTPFVDLADIAALLDPDAGCWEVTECPEVDWDLSYRFKGTLGSILRLYHVDRDRAFGLLYSRLKQHFG